MEDLCLMHYGVQGMKWGVRRYQNKDGTLTPRGRKRISKEYQKLMKKADQEVFTTTNYAKAYNKVADQMNNGLINKYNQKYEKKYGKDYSNPEYEKGYEKLFSDLFNKSYAEVIKEASDNSESFRKAQELVKQYDMLTFDDLARNNTEGYNAVLKYLSK